MKAKRILTKERHKITKELYPLTNRFWNQIPLDQVQDILSSHGVVILQEDNTEFSGWLCGRDSNTTFTLGDSTTKDENGMYTPIESCLYFSWYRHTTDRYEINMYIC